jgi:hypothetical protein
MKCRTNQQGRKAWIVKDEEQRNRYKHKIHISELVIQISKYTGFIFIYIPIYLIKSCKNHFLGHRLLMECVSRFFIIIPIMGFKGLFYTFAQQECKGVY